MLKLVLRAEVAAKLIIFLIMYPEIRSLCDSLSTSFDEIPAERKLTLEKIAQYIQSKKDGGQNAKLVYICTHNSRRSHFGQVWAAVAASYFGISKVETFSGGTEATAFNPSAITALSSLGFQIRSENEKVENPLYEVKFGDSNSTQCFSKLFDDPANPESEFAAIMTCSDAEENCPFIPGAELRIATSYDDPKLFDGTEEEAEKYRERALQIGREILFVFSLINS